MSELSREMVRTAPQIVNAIGKRELTLRGLNLAQLPATDGELWLDVVTNFDCLDLSDNVLKWIDAPALPTPSSSSSSSSKTASKAAQSAAAASAAATTPFRLSSLIMHKNQITGLSRAFATQLSATITSIVMHDNVIASLAGCNVFGLFTRLERLSLSGNPVQTEDSYRTHVIAVCAPSLKLLDFNKVRDAERAAAAAYREAVLVPAQRAEQEARQRKQQELAEQIQQGDGGALGAGRRAARKAAALESKRGREDATSAAGGVDNAAAVGGAGRAKPGPVDESVNANAAGMTEAEKEARRAALNEAMLNAETVEEMDRLELELKLLNG